MNWKEYENKVFDALSVNYIDDVVEKNFRVKGRYSKRSRQIDIYIKQRINDSDFITIVDSKNYNKKINVKTVESFISMIEDVGADYGILISELGFTKGALLRATNNPKGIDLDIYDFKSITHQLQGEYAFPLADKNAALILAPFGWIVDAKKREIPAICFLYKRGLTFEEALSGGEFAYVNFWNIEDDISNIKKLSDYQINNMSQIWEIENIDYQPSFNNLGNDALVRIIQRSNYPLIEITGFIRFDDFIFFCVCNTTEVYAKRNLRKMHTLLKQTLPLKVKRSKS